MFWIKSLIRKWLRKIVLKYAPPEAMPLIRHVYSKGGFLLRNNVILDTPSDGPVLILAPHPDDEAIGMGGTLIKHLTLGSKLTVLYMTDGRYEGGALGANLSKSEMIDVRRKEAKSIQEKYGFSQIFWEIEDTCLANDDETVFSMVKVLEDIRPQIIYVPSFFDHHYDHFSANQILVDSFQKLPDMTFIINQYEVWNQIPFPNYIVDVSSCYQEKKEMLSHYILPLTNVDYIRICENRNALHHSLYINSLIDGYAEAFYSFDSDKYQELYNDYLKALRDHGSNLPANISKS